MMFPDAVVVFAILNSAVRVFVAAILVFELIQHHQRFGAPERAGMGLMAGSSLQTITVIMDVHKAGTPFDGWAGTLFALGALVYFTGWLLRHRREYGRD